MEIDQKATKCPHCQAHQQWYRNPQHYGMLFLIPFLAFMFWQSSLFKSKKFTEYQKYFTVEKIKEIASDDDSKLIITYKVNNATNYKWEHLSYEIVGTDSNGELMLTDAGSEYSWVIQPDGESYLTVKVEKNRYVSSWSLEISDMETSRH